MKEETRIVTDGITITRAQLDAAFESWEQGFRMDPQAYRSQDDMARLEVSVLSAERSDYLLGLLKRQASAA